VEGAGYSPRPHRGDQEGQRTARRAIQAGGENDCFAQPYFYLPALRHRPRLPRLRIRRWQASIKPLPEREAVRLAIQIAAGLEKL